MNQRSIIPYEGSEPYIFISYAHRDSALVMPVLEELFRRGYRVWYDDGIAPGSEWPENIAQHLDGCALTLAFVSSNSIASANCRREVTFALSRQKPFLAVLLEPAKMSLGMEMQLSAQQCIMKYSYPDEDTFFRKLCSCPDLEPCLMAHTEPAYVTEALPASPAESPVVLPAELPAPVVVTPPAEEPVKKPKGKQKKVLTPKQKRTRQIIFGAVAAVLVLLFVLPMLTAVRLTPDKKVGRKDTYVSLYNEVITADTVRGLNKLKSLQTLVLTDCSFQAGAMDDLKLPALRYLTMNTCSGIDDLDFLRHSTELFSITLDNCRLSDSILPVFASSLEEITITGSPKVTNLNFLADTTPSLVNISGTGITSLTGLPLTQLETLKFSDTGISDISLLSNCPSLIMVKASSTAVTDISPLAALEKLTHIEFTGCDLMTPTEVFVCLRLDTLILEDTGITSLDFVQNCANLKTARISGNSIADISVLAKSAATLRELTLSGNPLTAEQLAFLKEATDLRSVALNGLPLENLNFLPDAPKLTCVSAIGCGLTDISALAGFAKLDIILLGNNRVTDISPLSALTEPTFVTLDLNGNPLTDASALPVCRYKALGLVCDSLDLSTIPNGVSGTVFVRYSDAVSAAAKQLKQFSTRYVLDCPTDKHTAMEDLFGTYGLHLATTAENYDSIAKAEGYRYP